MFKCYKYIQIQIFSSDLIKYKYLKVQLGILSCISLPFWFINTHIKYIKKQIQLISIWFINTHNKYIDIKQKTITKYTYIIVNLDNLAISLQYACNAVLPMSWTAYDGSDHSNARRSRLFYRPIEPAFANKQTNTD